MKHICYRINLTQLVGVTSARISRVNLAMTTSPADPPSGPEGRAEPRNNIFVAATLSSAEATGPIRIRNLSRQGALVEGGGLPPEGSAVHISRGSLLASGKIAWRKDNRAGIQFDKLVAVADWLPRGPQTQQQKIDEIVFAHKNGATGQLAASSAMAAPPLDVREELRRLEQMLHSITEDFARDAHVCERHLASIQLLDGAAEKLAKLARIAR